MEPTRHDVIYDPAEESAGIPTDIETLKSIALHQLDLALDPNNATAMWNAQASIAASLIVLELRLTKLANQMCRAIRP
jgi:hypothetical protein